MITIDSDPKANLISIGAFIILQMKQGDQLFFDIEELFYSANKKFKISYEVFVYSLDWLFLAGVVVLNEEGFLEYATE
ncbi:ABC-three component system middle component 6 [Oceanospirillum sediminis]|uniref:Uncharacterized protein n=1 Tax=Oceanospirillum sediminis TaxID=2760088 RepID=A0A839IUE9_9GAMM|nr:ABC-three component system middle component 6 [Oceanospirillum sediminis]MBB1489073.1 hypothetical protein [Oceanospirillum sediminis]